MVELQVPLDMLGRLAGAPPPGVRQLIADLVSQCAQREELRAALRSQPGSRFPHAALRRHIEVRERNCVFPGCRRPAMACQQDHTDEVRHGGVTVAENLGPLCVFHHGLKTGGVRQLVQPVPGWFRWTGPSGHRYRTRGEPITPALPTRYPGHPNPRRHRRGPRPTPTSRPTSAARRQGVRRTDSRIPRREPGPIRRPSTTSRRAELRVRPVFRRPDRRSGSRAL